MMVIKILATKEKQPSQISSLLAQRSEATVYQTAMNAAPIAKEREQDRYDDGSFSCFSKQDEENGHAEQVLSSHFVKKAKPAKGDNIKRKIKKCSKKPKLYRIHSA
jgi:hypothetical protein